VYFAGGKIGLKRTKRRGENLSAALGENRKGKEKEVLVGSWKGACGL